MRLGFAWIIVMACAACEERAADDNPALESGRGGAHEATDSGGHGGSSSGGGGSESGAGGSGGHVSVTGGSGGGGASGGAGGEPSADAAIDAAESPGDAMIEPGDESCVPAISDYKSPGPFDYESTSSGSLQIWKPAVPSGCKVPIVHFASGPYLVCGGFEPLLARLASHGFLALCYQSSLTDDGTQCIEDVELAREEYPDLVSDKVGFAGHCQGGVSAMLCASRAEERWPEHSFAVQASAPEHGFVGVVEDWAELYGEIEAPVSMFNGSEDMVAPAELVGQGLDHLAAEAEVTWYEATGAAHAPVDPWLQESALVWFRWKLLDDRDACAYWKAMPEGDAWDMQAESNAAPCE